MNFGEWVTPTFSPEHSAYLFVAPWSAPSAMGPRALQEVEKALGLQAFLAVEGCSVLHLEKMAGWTKSRKTFATENRGGLR